LQGSISCAGFSPYTGHKVTLRRLQDQVKMVGHQTIGMDLPPGFEAASSKISKIVPDPPGFSTTPLVFHF